jgi:hypothetical protein
LTLVLNKFPKLVKFQRQNRQLHTHEQILCYQLQQKRRLLNELKAELEYCRKKWALARAINNDSEEQLEQMRHEFAQRKIQDKNSAESGYSDEHVSDTESNEGLSDKDRIERFNKNLMAFDKIETTVCEEPVMYQFRKWRSESTLLHIFSASQTCSMSRAQSEPQNLHDSEEEEREIAQDMENYELVLIPNLSVYEDSLQSRIVASDDDDISQQQSLVINLPPKIHEHDEKKTLSKSKKNKKSKNKSQTETAESMFMRLMASMNGDESQTTSTASSIEEDEEDAPNIEEIPIDEVKEEIIQEVASEPIVEEAIAEAPSVECTSPSTSTENAAHTNVPSAEDEYLKRREIRLSRLEAEAKEFYERMSRSKEKRLQLNNHLDSVHQNFLDRQKEKDTNKDKGEPSSSGSAKKDDSDKDDENEKQ